MSPPINSADPQPRWSSPSDSTIEAVGFAIAEAFAVVDHNEEIEALLEELEQRLTATDGLTADELIARSKH